MTLPYRQPTKEQAALNPQMKEQILDLIAEGYSLIKIGKIDGLPTRQAIHYWLRHDPEFAYRYELAVQLRAEVLAEEMLDIADDTSQDVITDLNGVEKPNYEFINRSKLRVDTRKWHVARLDPRKYGDKTEHHLTGNIAHKHSHTHKLVKEMSETELDDEFTKSLNS